MTGTSCCFVPSLASCPMKSFIECQTSSIGFKCSDSGGVFTQLIPSKLCRIEQQDNDLIWSTSLIHCPGRRSDNPTQNVSWGDILRCCKVFIDRLLSMILLKDDRRTCTMSWKSSWSFKRYLGCGLATERSSLWKLSLAWCSRAASCHVSPHSIQWSVAVALHLLSFSRIWSF